MSYCLNLDCQKPHNPDPAEYCQSCGDRLRLKARYRPVTCLGQGGFGRTFIAVDDDLPSRPRCVVKQLYFINPEPTYQAKATQLFQQEALRLDELRHPQIPQLLAHFEQDNTFYLVQEYIEGPTLTQRKAERGCFSEAQLREVLMALLPVLDFIHQQNIIHRDIKPDNIIWCRQRETYVLIDFGIAKVMTEQNRLQTGTIIGSPEYMAPEQTRGKTVPATDLYSLGVTCLSLLTDVPPIDMFDIVENRWAWRDFLIESQVIGDSLGQILDRMVEGALNQRYSSAQEVLTAMQASIPGTMTRRPSAPTQAAVSQPLAKRSKRRSQRPHAKTHAPQISRTNSPAIVQWVMNRIQPLPPAGTLVSAGGIDYTELHTTLERSQWIRADQCTHAIMVHIAGKQVHEYLYERDIQQLPCEELKAIDELWLTASDGQFGFSTQVALYESAGADYGVFCQRVGWPVHQGGASQLQNTIRAPHGHFPSRSWAGGSRWWHHMDWLQKKWQHCGGIAHPS